MGTKKDGGFLKTRWLGSQVRQNGIYQTCLTSIAPERAPQVVCHSRLQARARWTWCSARRKVKFKLMEEVIVTGKLEEPDFIKANFNFFFGKWQNKLLFLICFVLLLLGGWLVIMTGLREVTINYWTLAKKSYFSVTWSASLGDFR